MLSLVSTPMYLNRYIHQVQVAGSWNDWKPEDLIKEEDCFILK